LLFSPYFISELRSSKLDDLHWPVPMQNAKSIAWPTFQTCEALQKAWRRTIL
jgi:hypothetical protein